jgi:hypothetical protein
VAGPDELAAYGRIRRAIAALLATLVAGLSVVDAASIDYSLDPVILGLMLGTLAVLLGVEAGSRLLK